LLNLKIAFTLNSMTKPYFKEDKGSWDISNGVKEAFDFHISWLKN